MALGDVGLLFKLKAEGGREAAAEVTKLRQAVKDEVGGIAQDVAGATGAFGSFTSRLGPAGVALGVVAGAGSAVVGTLFSIARQTAEAGARFHDLSIQSGLAVETISGLDLELRQAGTSAETLSRGAFEMQKRLGEAAQGNKELAATFAALGIRDTEAALKDTDGTLKTLLRSLADISDAGTRNALGSQVLGRAYRELSVFIRETNGDLDAAIAKAREAGLVWSTEAAAAADEFGDSLDELTAKSKALGYGLGNFLIPELNKLFRVMNAESQTSSSAVGSAFDFIRKKVQEATRDILIAVAALKTVQQAAAVIYAGQPGMIPDLFRANLEQVVREAYTPGPEEQRASPDFDLPEQTPKRRGLTEAQKEARKAAREAAQEEERQRGVIEGLGREYDRLRLAVGAYNMAQTRQEVMTLALTSGVLKLTEAHQREADEILKKIEAKKRDLASLQAGTELQKTLNGLVDGWQAANRGAKTAVDQVNDALSAFIDRGGKADETLRSLTERALSFARNQDIIAGLDRLLASGAGEVDPKSVVTGVVGALPPSAGPMVDPSTMGPPPEMFSRWEEFAMTVSSSLQTIGASAVTAGELVGGLFTGMAQGMGQSIQSWVLYGGSIGKAIKAAVASVLAGIAAESAVRAIYETALGFAALARMFFGDPRAAAEAKMHFTSAAIFASVAGASAIAGRAFSGGGAGAGAGAGEFGGTNEREDARSRYNRAQVERDRGTRREERRAEVYTIAQPIMLDGHEIARAFIKVVRDGGGARDDLRDGLGLAYG